MGFDRGRKARVIDEKRREEKRRRALVGGDKKTKDQTDRQTVEKIGSRALFFLSFFLLV